MFTTRDVNIIDVLFAIENAKNVTPKVLRQISGEISLVVLKKVHNDELTENVVKELSLETKKNSLSLSAHEPP